MTLFVLVVEAASVEVARALADCEQVSGALALVDSQLARCVLDALPLLQQPRGESRGLIPIQVLLIRSCLGPQPRLVWLLWKHWQGH